MQDGIYRVIFSTTSGTLAESVCMFQDFKFAGADFINSYTGKITYEKETFRAWMRCRRHGPEVKSMLNFPLEYDLVWVGRISADGFILESTLPIADVSVTAVGKKIA